MSENEAGTTDQAVARAIEERRTQLGLTVNEMVARSGVSAPGLAPLRKGVRRHYADTTKFGLAHALRWPVDAVDRLFAGETPDSTWVASESSGTASVLEAISRDLKLDDAGRAAVRAVYEAVAKPQLS